VVTMTFSTDRITDVVLDVSHETPGIGQAAAEALKKSLMASQSAEIDAVSGATITSRAVHNAAAKCIAQARGDIPVETITSEAKEDDGDWLGKAPEIAEKDIAETHSTDILVVGCGTGGMFAIASAAEAGGKVIGIDRFPVGTGVREDLGAIDSRYQKAWGTKIDKFEFIAMATQYAGGHIQQDLVKLWADHSGAVIDWLGDRLAERGIELWHESGDKDDETRYKHFPIGHSPRLPIDPKTGKFAISLSKVLYDYAVSKGARFDFSTKMIKLEKKNGRITGVIAQNAAGRYVRYNAAKGVVVATGGYAQNWKMMEALQPWNLRIIGRSGAMPGARGDGIRACLWVGAKMDETHSIMMFDRAAVRPNQKTGPETVKSGDSGFFWMGSQPWLKVNADGRRFMNESGTYENILHADEYQKGHCHYTLFDSNWMKYAEQFKMHGCSRMFNFENGADPNIPWQVVQQKMLPGLIAKGFVQQADTIEELARKLGLPAQQLKATVARHNELYRKGEDVDYGKEKHRLSAIDKPPFYGAKNTGWMLCTMDGIQIDTNLNAIDTEGNPIPGLYVIGNDS
ncbi:MAG: FAD-binding protein, partial [Sutterella sp.]